MYYAAISKAKRKEREEKERPFVSIDRRREAEISEMLSEIKQESGAESAAESPKGKSKDTVPMEDVVIEGEDVVIEGEDIGEEQREEEEGEGEEEVAEEEGADPQPEEDAVLPEAEADGPEAAAPPLEGAEEDSPASALPEELLNEEWEELCPVSEGARAASSDATPAPPTTDASGAMEEDISGKSKALREELAGKQASAQYAAMMAFRAKLPSYAMREQIVALVEKSQVVVISGETGCGKTTQVPQFILDDYIAQGRGAACKILCTQPRRISAISVAQRVAAERAETCGESVGYQIRLESKLPRVEGSILFCTTGILLRRLVGDPLMQDVSHIILDEIHERDLLSDFLIIVLRDILPKRPTLKLILMSATLNAEMFSAYFGGAPTLSIPGFTFPVREYWLEDTLAMLRYTPDAPQQQHASSRDRKRHRIDPNVDDEDGLQAYLDALGWESKYDPATVLNLRQMNYGEVDLGLCAALVQHICTRMDDGAVLVFLPGWDEISKLHDRLSTMHPFQGSSQHRIIPLHSMMPSASQQEIFERMPARKIVLSTNIAETSITIDDIVYVIDCGKTKEKGYDASKKISNLKLSWVSKASARQRRGRAGRVQDGVCFHLYTRFHSERLADFQLPEILRTPLEELCLQIKSLKLGKVKEFLAKALDSPIEQSVDNAIATLRMLDALDDSEDLTPLGYHLANLPVDPRIGKIMLFGAVFSCLDPVLVIAAALSHKDPFVIPLHKQREADAVRRAFAGESRSDHITLLRAFQGWKAAQRDNTVRDFCWRNFLSPMALQMIDKMRQQFYVLLHEVGFVSAQDDAHINANAGNTNLVLAVLCSGLYPNVASVEHPHGKGFGVRPPKLYTKEDGRVYLHPRSVIAEEPAFPTKWLMYHQKVETTRKYLYDASMVNPLALVFFGGKVTVQHAKDEETINIDDRIVFTSRGRTAQLMQELRLQMDRLLQAKIEQPRAPLPGHSNKLILAVVDLIAQETIDVKSFLSGKKGYGRR